MLLKNLTVLALSLSLALGTMVATASAASAEQPQGGAPGIVEFCEALIPTLEQIYEAEISVGACVSSLQSEAMSASLSATLCKSEAIHALVEELTGIEVTNVGQCIQVLIASIE